MTRLLHPLAVRMWQPLTSERRSSVSNDLHRGMTEDIDANLVLEDNARVLWPLVHPSPVSSTSQSLFDRPAGTPSLFAPPGPSVKSLLGSNDTETAPKATLFGSEPQFTFRPNTKNASAGSEIVTGTPSLFTFGQRNHEERATTGIFSGVKQDQFPRSGGLFGNSSQSSTGSLFSSQPAGAGRLSGSQKPAASVSRTSDFSIVIKGRSKNLRAELVYHSSESAHNGVFVRTKYASLAAEALEALLSVTMAMLEDLSGRNSFGDKEGWEDVDGNGGYYTR
jgi:hypothetical protein